MARSGLPPPSRSNKWCDTSRNVCSGRAGTTASSNKKCMPCLGRVLPFSGDGWALWIIRSKHKHEFWQRRFTPACTRTPPRSGVIHQSHRYWCVHQGAHYPPTSVKLESTYMLLLRLTLEVIVLVRKFSFLPNDSHSSPGYVFTCGILCASFSKTFCSISPPPPRHFHRDLIKTTFTHSLSSHDCSLSMFSLCNEVSE